MFTFNSLSTGRAKFRKAFEWKDGQTHTHRLITIGHPPVDRAQINTMKLHNSRLFSPSSNETDLNCEFNWKHNLGTMIASASQRTIKSI